MTEVIRRLPWDGSSGAMEPLVSREWLLTNGLGGYASGTLSGIMTRKYHGYLVAALPTPLGRIVMLQNLTAAVHLGPAHAVLLDGEQRAGQPPDAPGARYLREFRLEL